MPKHHVICLDTFSLSKKPGDARNTHRVHAHAHTHSTRAKAHHQKAHLLPPFSNISQIKQDQNWSKTARTERIYMCVFFYKYPNKNNNQYVLWTCDSRSQKRLIIQIFLRTRNIPKSNISGFIWMNMWPWPVITSKLTMFSTLQCFCKEKCLLFKVVFCSRVKILQQVDIYVIALSFFQRIWVFFTEEMVENDFFTSLVSPMHFHLGLVNYIQSCYFLSRFCILCTKFQGWHWKWICASS